MVDKKAPEISQPVLGADDKNKDINCPEKEDGKYYPNATGTKLSFSVTEKNTELRQKRQSSCGCSQSNRYQTG